MRISRVGILLSVGALGCAMAAQEAPAANTGDKPSQDSMATKPMGTALAKLQAAKTVYVKNAGGNEIPFNVISNKFAEWPRYAVVGSPEQADLLVEVFATEVEDKSRELPTSSLKESGGATLGKDDETKKETKYYLVPMIRMVVTDIHSKSPVWINGERPKSPTKKKPLDDTLVESSGTLFQHFHDRVEPPVPAQ